MDEALAANRAEAISDVDVGFYVIFQLFLLRKERLAQVALKFIFIVVDFHVTTEVFLRAESFVANFANYVFRSDVGEFVMQQIRCVGERLTTLRALVDSFDIGLSKMVRKGAVILESFVAKVASDGFVGLYGFVLRIWMHVFHVFFEKLF